MRSVDISCQRVYQELVYRKKPFQEMSKGLAALTLASQTPSPLLPVLFSRFLNPRGPNYLGAWNRLRKIILT